MATAMTRPLRVGVALLLFTQVTTAQPGVPPAYHWAARANDVPTGVLFAIALQESGTVVRGRLMPWPWTLNVGGSSLRYPTRTSACIGLHRALRGMPATRVDVGLGQLNVGYQGYRVRTPCELLDPYLNLLLAGRILREQRRHAADWLTAVGRYHRPAGGLPAMRYQQSVEQHLIRLAGASVAASTLREST